MRTDALVLGSELSGLIAAQRLLDRGKSVRLLASGGGALHYGSGGLHLLGYASDSGEAAVEDPYAALGVLDQRHPLQRLGEARVRAAVAGFLKLGEELGLSLRSSGRNRFIVSLAGQPVPTFASGAFQATFEELEGRTVAVFCFAGHKDFPAGVMVSEMRRRQIEAHLLRLDDPCKGPSSLRLARFFDSLRDPAAYFQSLLGRLPERCACVLFPAVMGLERHDEIMAAAERSLGLPCREVPTLPPSIPGLRLNSRLTRRLQSAGALLHPGARAVSVPANNGRCTAVTDQHGRRFEAEVFVVATGGILMGGLEVDSRGEVHEPFFGLDVADGGPLKAEGPVACLDALHEAGVETDDRLRPLNGDTLVYENLFVTGRTLAHWNPAKESSDEGVSIATGWAAAEEACHYMEGR